MQCEVTIAEQSMWQRVREMRIKALARDPLAYGARAEIEAEYPETHWRESITQDRWILLSIDGRDVAVAAVSDHMPELVAQQCADPRGAWIYGCWVEPDCRGRGLAGELLGQGDHLAVERGLPQIGLGVFVTNVAARRAYERLGLRALGEPLRSVRRPEEFYQPMTRAVATSSAPAPRV